MTSERFPVRSEIRWLYKALLRPNRVRVQIDELVGFYKEYEDFRRRVLKSKVAPTALKGSLPNLKKPKYVMWAEKFLCED